MAAETFDHDRHVASLEALRHERTRRTERSHPSLRSRAWVATDTESSLPGTAEVDVREVWMASREVTERFTVGGRVTGTDIIEPETAEECDLDVWGPRRSVVEQGMVDTGNDLDGVSGAFEIESELGGGDRIHTHITHTSAGRPTEATEADPAVPVTRAGRRSAAGFDE